MNKDQRIITYVPKAEDDQPASDMGTIRRGLWMYTHKLGLNFSLVLLLSLSYQVFVAVFIALKGIQNLPIFSTIIGTGTPGQILGLVGAIGVAIVIQGLIIAEMAQVVWLRHPDKLKVRLMSGSFWWWIMLVALIATITIDFFLLFLSITEQVAIDKAWNFVMTNQMTGATILLFSILNFLTLLRCASVMRTSTSEEIRREVEERLHAISEEILIDAGDSARAKAAKVWSKLSVNPQRFVPIHDSVLNLISQNHPELVPPQIGGDTWAYDFSGNTFAVLPPDVHMALLQNRHRPMRQRPALSKGRANNPQIQADSDDNRYLWNQPPSSMAEMIGYNLETYGKPKFVDITEPDQPKFLTRPIELAALGFQAPPPPQLASEATTAPIATPVNPASVAQSLSNNFSISSLSAKERALFGAYLTKTVFPHVHNQEFPQGVADIFQVFDELELQWYYRHWKSYWQQAAANGQLSETRF